MVGLTRLGQISVKLDKLRQTVIVNQKDYGNYVRVLKETYGSVRIFQPYQTSFDSTARSSWFSMWKAYCDVSAARSESHRLRLMPHRNSSVKIKRRSDWDSSRISCGIIRIRSQRSPSERTNQRRGVESRWSRSCRLETWSHSSSMLERGTIFRVRFVLLVAVRCAD